MFLKETSHIWWLALCVIILLLSPSLAHSTIPLPTSQQFYSLSPQADPLIDQDPAKAKPIGVGNVSDDHDLSLQIGLDKFSSAVDIYLALFSPVLSQDFFLFHPDGSIVSLSQGFVPWKAGVTDQLNEKVMGTIPMSLIPTGDYMFALLVTEATANLTKPGQSHILWATTVRNIRAADVASKAASYLGGDAEAASSILMALGNGHSLEDIVQAVMEMSLSQYGSIESNPGQQGRFFLSSQSSSNLPSFCNPQYSREECHSGIVNMLLDTYNDLEISMDGTWNGTLESFDRWITAYTLYLAHLGYSGDQIHNAITGELFDGETYICETKSSERHPFGGICERCGNQDCFVTQKIDLLDIFSDMDPEDFDVPDNNNPTPGIGDMNFPAYYKGSGYAKMTYTNPNRGSIDCSVQNMVFVAQVGGIGLWDGRLKVIAETYQRVSPTGELSCRFEDWGYEVAEGYYDDIGSYSENFDSDTYVGNADIDFNKTSLWGKVKGTQSRSVYGGEQMTHREFVFELQRSTEAEYNAFIK